jgi:hypothetical protein
MLRDLRRAVDSYHDPHGLCDPPEGFRREIVNGEALDVRIGYTVLPCPGEAHSSGGANCDRCWRHVWGLIAVADEMLAR